MRHLFTTEKLLIAFFLLFVTFVIGQYTADANHTVTAAVSSKLEAVEKGVLNIYSRFDKINSAVEICQEMKKELPGIQQEFKEIHKHLTDIQRALKKHAKD